MKVLFFIVFFFSCSSFYAQNDFTLKGTVKNDSGDSKIISVISLTSNDSVKRSYITQTDSVGHYLFKSVHKGVYVLEATPSAQGSSVSETIAINDNITHDILIKKQEILDEVVIQSKKKAFQLVGDKFVADPSLLPGYNTDNSYEILSKIPGVWVSGDGLRLNGSGNIMILLNGKKQSMSASQVIVLLQSIPASNLEKVEIITGGSAKYDATGGSIINIVTKNKFTDGLNIILTNNLVAYKFAEIGNNHGFFGSYQQNKFQLQIGYGFRNDYSKNSSEGFTTITGDQPTTIQNISETFSKSTSHGLTTVMNYEINPKNSIHFNFNKSFSKGSATATDNGTYTASAPFTLNFLNNSSSRDDLNSLYAEYEMKLDTIGGNITAGYGYLGGYTKNNMRINNIYEYENSQTPLTQRGNIPLKGHQNIVSIDLELPLKDNKFESGVKFTSGQISNNVAYYDLINGGEQINLTRSDSLKYLEDVYAGYAIYSFKINNNFSAKLGARIEHTKTQSISWSGNSKGENSYTNFLPNASINYKSNNLSGSLRFTSGLTRPDYNYLNPYVYYIDEFNSRVGNGLLRPQTRYTTSLQISPFDFLYINMGYHRLNDFIRIVRRQVDNGITTLQKPENALNVNDFFADITVSYVLVQEKLTGQLNMSGEVYNYDIKDEFFTSSEDLKNRTWGSISWNNTYKLTPKVTLESSVIQIFRGQYYQNEQSARWRVDLGASYSFLKNKMRAYFKVNDVFDTMNYDVTSYYDNYRNHTTLDNNYFNAQFGLRYNFDAGIKRQQKNGKNDNDEEKSRFN